MKTPTKNAERITGIFLVGLFFCAIFIELIWVYSQKVKELKRVPIEQAMYVTDWDITNIYGPGSAQQKSIVTQLRSSGNSQLKFTGPVLYRMHSALSPNPDQDVLLRDFDPDNPERINRLKTNP